MYVSYASINLRNQVRKDEDVPLQFVYEAADCRIFYTPQTFYNYPALWKYAADAIWTKPDLCVKDSTGYATAKATDTKGPDPSVLVKAPVEAPPNMGQIIMSMFLGSDAPDDTGIEAVITDKKVPRKTSKTPVLTPAKKCNTDLTCNKKREFCYEDYKQCIKGVTYEYPACVPECTPSNVATRGDCTGPVGVKCISYNTYDTLGWSVPAAYCKPPVGTCKSLKGTAVKQGEGGGPSRRKD